MVQAIAEDDRAQVERWIRRGADPTIQNWKGYSAFDEAIFTQSWDLVYRFAQMGAKPDTTASKVEFFVHSDNNRGHVHKLHTLLMLGMSIPECHETISISRIFRACFRGKEMGIMTLFMDAGCSPDIDPDNVWAPVNILLQSKLGFNAWPYLYLIAEEGARLPLVKIQRYFAKHVCPQALRYFGMKVGMPYDLFNLTTIRGYLSPGEKLWPHAYMPGEFLYQNLRECEHSLLQIQQRDVAQANTESPKSLEDLAKWPTRKHLLKTFGKNLFWIVENELIGPAQTVCRKTLFRGQTIDDYPREIDKGTSWQHCRCPQVARCLNCDRHKWRVDRKKLRSKSQLREYVLKLITKKYFDDWPVH